MMNAHTDDLFGTSRTDNQWMAAMPELSCHRLDHAPACGT
jgi:hypothetical protein